MKTLSSAFEAVGRISWSFFKNAFAVFPRLIQNTPTLMSIMALLSMAIFLSGTTDSKTMMLLLSSATKQSCMLSGLDSFQEPVVVEDKQRTISVAYLLEETCFSNSGFRLATSNSISEIHLPQKIEQQRTAGVDHGTPFWPRVELAIIESKAQKLLQKASRLVRFSKTRFLRLDSNWKLGGRVCHQPFDLSITLHLAQSLPTWLPSCYIVPSTDL